MATTLKGLFKNIADSIRECDGTTDEIQASEFADRIRALEAGENIDIFTAIATGEITEVKASYLEGITCIGSYAFSGCSKLTTVTLPSSITLISFVAFSNCDNLITINVPWSKNYIYGAPWGATNATINYNYTG